MYLKFNDYDNILEIALIGELDHHNAKEARVKMDDRIERGNIKKVILNFNSVTFMDSSGIGVVVGRQKKVSKNGGELYIAGANKSINRVFELSGLYKIIKNFSTVEEALNCI
ncbi:anti-sigma F factor antagonist [Clostridium thermobutyricum]|uniref:Anti-sigma F factor antagonist n=2 Tax=Clostridium thermobutyricum TaxID=29372 RepID=N9Y359_9CLOT|nr:anti-sigma F factor antagonist [Clostridium thermobutyricum]ENZ02227.1 anti-sigma F factor antagonist [Clostridium thermobutyricum]OPX45312.1 anti-sigma F factor antagonist [Clostridium thermobutyricum DSM 4928]